MTHHDTDTLAEALGTLSCIHETLIAQMDLTNVPLFSSVQTNELIVLCEYAQGHVEQCFQVLLKSE